MCRVDCAASFDRCDKQIKCESSHVLLLASEGFMPDLILFAAIIGYFIALVI